MRKSNIKVPETRPEMPRPFRANSPEAIEWQKQFQAWLDNETERRTMEMARVTLTKINLNPKRLDG